MYIFYFCKTSRTAKQTIEIETRDLDTRDRDVESRDQDRDVGNFFRDETLPRLETEPTMREVLFMWYLGLFKTFENADRK
jgi:hypothetical protein